VDHGNYSRDGEEAWGLGILSSYMQEHGDLTTKDCLTLVCHPTIECLSAGYSLLQDTPALRKTQLLCSTKPRRMFSIKSVKTEVTRNQS
jgi:hypothetical protein